MQSSEQVNNIAPNYRPEVETEKPFTRKRKENVKKTIWTERSCVYFDETSIVESLIDKTAWWQNIVYYRSLCRAGLFKARLR